MHRTEKSSFVFQLAASECWESWHFLPHGALRRSKILRTVYRESNFCKNQKVSEKSLMENTWMYVVEKVIDCNSQRERKETEIESGRTKGKMGKEMKGRDGKLCNNPRSLLYHNHSAVRQSVRQGRVWTARPRCHLLPIKSYKNLNLNKCPLCPVLWMSLLLLSSIKCVLLTWIEQSGTDTASTNYSHNY